MKKLLGKLVFPFTLAGFLCYLGLYMVYYGLVTWWFWHTAEAKSFVYRDGGWREQ